MLTHKTLAASFILALGILSAGCAVGTGESSDEPAVDENAKDGEVGEASEAWTIDSGGYNTIGWDSGVTNNLSSWENLSCYADYGSTYMMTALRVFRESSGNLDNFVGKLGGECTSFNVTTGQSGTSTGWVNIFAGPQWRTPGLPWRSPRARATPPPSA
jgi:hypothetical protein